MKVIVSLIVAAATFFAVGISLDELTQIRGDEIGPWAAVAGIIAFLISLYIANTGKGGVAIASGALAAINDAKDTIESNIDSKQADLYARAENEYDNGEIDKGLWSQALVKAKGDEKLRIVEYMKLRAKQLKRQT